MLLFITWFITIFLASKTTVPPPSPPKYRNPTLEQTIAKNENQEKLQLNFMELSDADMEIVAYYALQRNKVIQIVKMHLS